MINMHTQGLNANVPLVVEEVFAGGRVVPSAEAATVVGHCIQIVHRRGLFVLRTNHILAQILWKKKERYIVVVVVWLE